MARFRFPGLALASEVAISAALEGLIRRLDALEKKPGAPAVVTSDFGAREGQFVRVQAPSAGLRILLPRPTAANRGAEITFSLETPGPVTFECVAGLVNRELFVVSTLLGTFKAICNGETGWGVGFGITSSGATPGPAGPAGPPGGDGFSGGAGVTEGPPGDMGPPGSAGAPGAAGLQGPPGADGSDGADGPPGQLGAAGATGSTGLQGAPIVADGAEGPAGDMGPPGVTGAPGSTGLQGAPGVDGADGADGVAGAVGPVGATGATGADGRPGIDGDPGADGEPGPPGATGSTGLTGAAGNPGPDGEVGATGEMGPQGATGPTLGWPASLAIDRTSGAVNPLIDTGQYLQLGSGAPPATGQIRSAATILCRSSDAISCTAGTTLSLQSVAAMTVVAGTTLTISSAGDLIATSSAGQAQLNSTASAIFCTAATSVTLTAGTAVALVSAANRAVQVTSGLKIMSEQPAGTFSGNAAGQGLIWLRNDTPNNLIFKDDANTERRIVTAPAPLTDLANQSDSTILLRAVGAGTGPPIAGSGSQAGAIIRDVAPISLAVVASNIAIPFVIYVAFAAGGGAADDVTVYAAAAPFAFRIIDVTVIIATPVLLSSVQLRDATGGGGAVLSSSLSTSIAPNTVRNDDTTTRTVPLGGSVYLRRSTGSVAGELVITAIRT